MRVLVWVCLMAAVAPAKTVYVDVGGDDDDDGLTPGTAVATITRGAQLVTGGDVLEIGPGTYYERPVFWRVGSAAAPVWVRAATPGTVTISGMWPEAARGEVVWRDDGEGVWSAPHVDPVLYGAWHDTFLFRFNTVEDLRTAYASGVDLLMPGHGFAHEGGRVHVRLPGAVDPNGEPVRFSTPSWDEPGIETAIVYVYQSPSIILDGLRVEGSGTSCVWFDAASPGATVRNTRLDYCTIGLRLDDGALVEWSEYSYPGFYDFAEEVRALNGEWKPTSMFTLVKQYHPAVRLEGGLATSTWRPGRVSSVDAEFRYNFMHQAFDGEVLGSFEFSESHHNVYLYNYDNHIEFEIWTGALGRDLRLHHSLLMACNMGPISHQGSTILGPHVIDRNVIYGYDSHGWGSWAQVKSKAPNATEGISLLHNVFWGGYGGLVWEPDNLEFINNIIIFDHTWDSAANAPVADHNLLVNDADLPFLYGPGGAYLGSDPAALGFLDAGALNFGVAAGGPTQDAGMIIPGYNEGEPGGPDIGPFEAGFDPGLDWPRPAETTYTADPPERWPAP